MHSPAAFKKDPCRTPPTARPLCLACLLIVLVLSLALPASAATYTINASIPIGWAIGQVADGDTLILNPGTYNQGFIQVTKSITLRANTSAGGNAGNTIIDARSAGRIFNNSAGPNTLVLDNLTLRNGYSSADGGAILVAAGATLVANSTTFSNCSAKNGGAIANNGTLMAFSSAFTGCSAATYGGAILNGGTITAISSSFTDCSAGGGGAIFNNGTISSLSSAFSRCSAENGGAILNSGTISSLSSTFSRCQAPVFGGAIVNGDGGTISAISSVFSDCSASMGGGAILNIEGSLPSVSSSFSNCSAPGGAGGALYSAGYLTSVSSSFSNCSASLGGGAIVAAGSFSSITTSFTNCSTTNDGGAIFLDQVPAAAVSSSSFTGCTAAGRGGAVFSRNSSLSVSSTFFRSCSAGDKGGAILNENSTLTATGSSFTGCSATYGGAISSAKGFSVHFSRFYKNSAIVGRTLHVQSGTADAIGNWWGTNAGPSGSTSGDVSASPWLMLGAAAAPKSITSAGTSVVRANLTFLSDGSDTGGANHVPDGIPVTFVVTGGGGTLKPLKGGTVSGKNATVYTPAAAGTKTISATADGQTVPVQVTVTAALPSVTGIIPASGVRGRLVVISNLSGTNFTAGANVTLNRTGYPNIIATNVSVTSPKKITCTFPVPANAPLGLRNVFVRSIDGKIGMKVNAFNVKAASAPAVNGITPAAGTRGRLVWITSLSGTGFVGTPKPKVQFLRNAVILNATNVSVASAQKITCSFFLPAGAATGAWNVRVTNGDNQAGTKAGAFRVDA